MCTEKLKQETSSPNIVQSVKARRMKQIENVALMEGTEKEHKILVENPQRMGLIRCLDTEGRRKILKWTERKTGLEGTDDI